MDTIAVMTRALIAALALIACACAPGPEPTCDPFGTVQCEGDMGAVCVGPSGGCRGVQVICDLNGIPTCGGTLSDGEAVYCVVSPLQFCRDRQPPDGPTCEAPGGGALAAPECVGSGLPYCVTASGCTNNSPPLCDMDGPTCAGGETVQCLEAVPPSC